VTTSFPEAFFGRPAIIAFFYTRCDNPLRCSLTISQLATVQRLLRADGIADKIQLAAITYDPGFDLPIRLRKYAQDRGLDLGQSCRLFRSIQLDVLRNHFGLGVSFLGSLVNRHRIELFLLDAQGRTAGHFERLRWSPEEVARRATGLLRDSPIAPVARSGATMAASSIALLLLPKCPACWAAYASLAGLAGSAAIPLPLVRASLLAIFCVSFLVMILRIRARRRF
jgi:protein SCO1/2